MDDYLDIYDLYLKKNVNKLRKYKKIEKSKNFKRYSIFTKENFIDNNNYIYDEDEYDNSYCPFPGIDDIDIKNNYSFPGSTSAMVKYHKEINDKNEQALEDDDRWSIYTPEWTYNQYLCYNDPSCTCLCGECFIIFKRYRVIESWNQYFLKLLILKIKKNEVSLSYNKERWSNIIFNLSLKYPELVYYIIKFIK